MKNKTILSIAFGVLVCLLAYTGRVNAQASDILSPKGMVKGCLSNGLNYILLNSSSPASRVEFRLVYRVGSAFEKEQEKGCSHFVEHMAFGGTRHFPNRGLVKYLESLGMKYGEDINAFTGFDRTIYMFGAPTDHNKEEVINRSLLIMRDWIDGITFEPEKVENEKGIIFEELRGYDVGDEFYNLKIGQGIFKERMPLGEAKDIRKVTPECLKSYYNKWYVPSLATLVIVGDIDPMEVKAKIEKQFSSINKPSTAELVSNKLVYSKGLQLSELRDSLLESSKLEFIIPHPEIVISSMSDAVRSLQRRLLVRAISDRFYRMKLSTNVSDAWYLSDKNHFVFTVDGRQRQDLLNNISETVHVFYNLIKNGWSEEELNETKKKYGSQLDYQDFSEQCSGAWCDDFVDLVISKEHSVTDREQQKQLQEALGKTTSEELQAVLKSCMDAHNEALLIAAKTHLALGASLTKEELAEAWLKGEQMECQPFVYVPEKIVEDAKIATPPCLAVKRSFRSKSIDKITTYPQLNIREVKLKNGINLILKQTPSSERELLVNIVAPYGTSSLSAKDYPMLEGAGGYMDMGGIAKMDFSQFSDYIYQKGMSLNLVMDRHWHGLLGMSPTDHASEFFNLIYEKITDPELRHEDFEELRTELLKSHGKETVLEKMLKRTPDRLLSACRDSLMGASLNPGSNELTQDQIKKLSLDDMAQYYKKLYMRPNEMTVVICGNFNVDSLTQQFVSTFDQLPRQSKRVGYQFPKFDLPQAMFSKRFPNDNQTQTVFDYYYHGKYEPSLNASLTLKLMRDIVRNRLISEIRERESLVYSPYISLNYEGMPWNMFYFDINASAENKNMSAINGLLKSIMLKLQKEEISEHELQTIKRSFLIAKRESLLDDAPAIWRTTLVGLVKNGEKLSDFERYEESLNAITPQMIRKAFAEYIDLENYVLLYLSNNDFKDETNQH